MDAATGHVPVLGHADVAVTEMVGADSGGEAFVVDESGDGFRKLWVVASGTPSSSLAERHSFRKLFGSRRVPAVDGKMTHVGLLVEVRPSAIQAVPIDECP